MSAPVTERRSPTAPARDGRARRSAGLAPSRAPSRIPAQRMSDRLTRDERSNRPGGARRGERPSVHAGRAKFVLLVMTLLAAGLVATLWLSTAAAADSYRLQQARTRAGALTEQSEQLRKQVTTLNSPASLAQRAAAQGMVPVQDPARLVVGPDGSVDVVGNPTAAQSDGPPPSAPGPVAAAPAPAQSDTGDPAAASGATTTGTQVGGRG